MIRPGTTPIHLDHTGTPTNLDHLQHDTIHDHNGNPYLTRHYITRDPKTRSIQLHHFHADDPDPDPHDHPWDFTTLILHGAYTETTRNQTTRHTAGTIRTVKAETAHKLTDIEPDTWTLITTGPVRRTWGYHTPTGWTPWRTYQHRPPR